MDCQNLKNAWAYSYTLRVTGKCVQSNECVWMNFSDCEDQICFTKAKEGRAQESNGNSHHGHRLMSTDIEVSSSWQSSSRLTIPATIERDETVAMQTGWERSIPKSTTEFHSIAEAKVLIMKSKSWTSWPGDHTTQQCHTIHREHMFHPWYRNGETLRKNIWTSNLGQGRVITHTLNGFKNPTKNLGQG